MLVLSRGYGQEIKIGDNIRIVVVDIRGRAVRLGIDAPKDIQIVRDDAVNKNPRNRDSKDAKNDAMS